MGKAVSLREADLNSQIQGHFVSSFASDNSIKGNFAAYKNSLSSSIYKDRRVSVSSQSPKTLKHPPVLVLKTHALVVKYVRE